MRILLVKVSEEKVLPDWAARVLSDDVWLSAVSYKALPISCSREGSATYFWKTFSRHMYLYGGIEFVFSVPE